MGKGRIENLVKNEDLTPEERRRNARKAGKASGAARKKKKDLKQALELLLEMDITDRNGNKKSGTEIITAALFKRAATGDVRAFETIRATIGQDPVKKVLVTQIDQSVIDEVEQAVLNAK